MTTLLNQFATWLFNTLTTIWNFGVNNPLLQWVIGIYLISILYNEFKKYIKR